MRISSLIIVSVFIVSIISCNSGSSNTNQSSEKESQKLAVNETEKESATSGQEFMESGKKVYDRVCLVCHQTDGSGVPNMYPPIIESDYIMGNTDSLIHIILDGMKGPVIVKGEEYNSIMPPQKGVLDDQEVADLINYLRNSFDNSGEFVKPEDVEAMR